MSACAKKPNRPTEENPGQLLKLSPPATKSNDFHSQVTS